MLNCLWLQCDTLSSAGLIWVIGLALFAAPFCFIPCCMDRCALAFMRRSFHAAPCLQEAVRHLMVEQGYWAINDVLLCLFDTAGRWPWPRLAAYSVACAAATRPTRGQSMARHRAMRRCHSSRSTLREASTPRGTSTIRASTLHRGSTGMSLPLECPPSSSELAMMLNVAQQLPAMAMHQIFEMKVLLLLECWSCREAYRQLCLEAVCQGRVSGLWQIWQCCSCCCLVHAKMHTDQLDRLWARVGFPYPTCSL